MENQEPKHLKVLRIIGFSLISIGVILLFLGLFVVKMEFGSNDEIAHPAVYVPGIFLCVFSIPCLFLGYSAKIQKAQIATQKYIQGETKADLTEMADTGAEIVAPAVKKISKAVKDGVKKETVFCKHCGVEIDADSTFCKSCGKKQ